MKKTIKLTLLLLLLFTIAGCNKKNKISDNQNFNTYLDELFIEFLGNDPYDVNSTLLDPTKYGIEISSVEPYEFNEEADEEYYSSLKEVKNKLLTFKDNVLSEEQQLSKKILLDYIDRKLAFEGLYYYGSNLGSYLGYQAQLPIILAEYRFDDINDINHYFEYLEITKTNFEGIIQFEKEKIALGMGLTDYIIDKVIDQCEAFVNAEENYLIPVFNDKIDKLDFLTDLEKESLKQNNDKLISEDFVGAYNYLVSELRTMKGYTAHNGALANFPEGKKYYEALFRQATGTNMSVLEAKEYLIDKANDVRRNIKSNYEILYSTDLMQNMDLDELLPFFKTKMDKDFPSLKIDVDYNIKEISESMQENSSPAMYFISPIDANVVEAIYINPLNFNELSNYTYQTLAHEGYPGHLYQNVYLKSSDLPEVRKTLHYVGYSEGWATYVENYVVGYVNKDALAAFELYDSLTYVYLGLLDIGINYEGWSEQQAYDFVSSIFVGITRNESDEMYYDLTEIPTNYLQYYFSYYQVQDLKNSFKEKMGSNYSDKLFHTIYLETGPSSFTILKEQYENYKR